VRRPGNTNAGCLIVLLGALGVVLGAALGMHLMADDDPRQYACPPGLIWGANGAVLGGFAGLIAGWLLEVVVSWHGRRPARSADRPDAEPGVASDPARDIGSGSS
jgi:hypothetical protein